MLMGQDDSDFACPMDQNELRGTELHEEITEEAIISMHATSNHPIHNTMCFKGQVGIVLVYALIDSGSTHNFVSPSVLHENTHYIIVTNPMIMMVANADRMVINSKCTTIHFSIQGHEFEHDLRVLPVKGYDIILGLDWLSKFGPMRVDWQNKWVEINTNGNTVKL
jgi:Retroviral aspartyl protease